VEGLLALPDFPVVRLNERGQDAEHSGQFAHLNHFAGLGIDEIGIFAKVSDERGQHLIGAKNGAGIGDAGSNLNGSLNSHFLLPLSFLCDLSITHFWQFVNTFFEKSLIPCGGYHYRRGLNPNKNK
jgi:hypothetical protein